MHVCACDVAMDYSACPFTLSVVMHGRHVYKEVAMDTASGLGENLLAKTNQKWT